MESEFRTLKTEVIGVGPSGRGLKTLNNKNNLEELYLKKKLEHYKREHTFSIAHIDRERFDTRDFLKSIYQTESDSHPAAIQYLGRDPTKATKQSARRHRTASGDPDSDTEEPPLPIPAQTRTPNFNQSRKNMLFPPSTQISVTDKQKQESVALEEHKSAIQRKETLDLKSSLPSLERKKSIYLQIAAVLSKTEENTCASSDSSECSSPDELTQSKGRQSKRGQSFMAWVQDQKNESCKEKYSLANILKKTDPLEQRRNEFRQWLADRKEQRERTERKYSHLLEPSSFRTNDQNVMESPNNISNSTATKPRKLPSFHKVGRMVSNMAKVKKKPIKERLTEFYSKCNDLKLENLTIELTDAQKKRRWKMLTKGVKAALEDSSDEDECGNWE